MKPRMKVNEQQKAEFKIQDLAADRSVAPTFRTREGGAFIREFRKSGGKAGHRAKIIQVHPRP